MIDYNRVMAVFLSYRVLTWFLAIYSFSVGTESKNSAWHNKITDSQNIFDVSDEFASWIEKKHFIHSKYLVSL